MGEKVRLDINNNKCKIDCSLRLLNELDKVFAIKNPNAYHIRRFFPRGWDGKMHYITESGYIKSGLVPKLHRYLTEKEHEVIIHDHRLETIEPEIPEKIGEHTPRDYQREAIEKIIFNKVGDVPYRIGVIDAATNAGKTTIMAGIYLAFKRKAKCIVLLNDGDLFEQFKKEMPLLVGKDFGYVRGTEKKWNNFTVAMVQTLARDIKQYAHELNSFEIALVDEADLADNKSYKKILQNLVNTSVRVGLSGTIYMSKLAKDQMGHENLRSFFGDILFKITKKEMVDKGHSTEVIVKVVQGNTLPGVKGSYKDEYDKCITNNPQRHLASWKRVLYNAKRKRMPMLVICQFHKHIDALYKFYKEQPESKRYRIAAVHHETPNRLELLQQFRDGKIDILIASFIVKRGKNFPLLRYLQNAAGSDSNATVSQLWGRLERKHASKSKAYMDDLFDEGHYLKRHSKHRINYYRRENMRILVKV